MDAERDGGVRASVRRTIARHPAPVAFVLAYWVVFTVIGIVNQRPVTGPYLVLLIPLTTLAAYYEDRFRLGRTLVWALAIWGAMHMAGGILDIGEGPTFYFAWVIPDVLRYDQLVHAFGTGLVTLVAGRILLRWLGRLGFGAAVLLVLVGLGAASLAEITEFISTKVSERVNVGDYDNNGWDLIFNLGGAIAAAAWTYREARRERPTARDAATEQA